VTTTGWIHLLSAVYLSGALSLAISVNENRRWPRILRETARRWAKFLIFAIGIGFVVFWLS
jgi:hypothetical protein